MNFGGFPFPGATPMRNQYQDKFSKLQYILPQCNYKPQNVHLVNQAAIKVMQEHSQLNCDTICFNDKGTIKTMLEIKGSIAVNYKGNSYSIQTNIMLPQNFPQQRPYLRIMNPDPNSFQVNSFYQNFQSKHDPTSYLLTDLTTMKCWGVYSSITGILQQAQLLMSQHFPFKKKQTLQIQAPVTGFNSNQYFPKSSPPLKSEQPKMIIPPKYDSGYGDPTHNAPKKLTPQQQKAKLQLQQYKSKNLILAQQNSRIASQLGTQRVKDFFGNQNLFVLKDILQNQNNRLSSQSKQMQKFVQTNDKNGETISLRNIVGPSNEFSAQLLDFIASYKASSQCICHLQNLFSNKQIDLQTLLRLLRKTQQQRFTAKYLTNKLMSKTT